jgi:Flp pilus assembly pilin Flp
MTFGTKMKKILRRFYTADDGAVTADWVVLAAAVCLLSVPVLSAVLGAVDSGATTIAAEVQEHTD